MFTIVARVAAEPVRVYTFVVAPIGLIISWLFDLALYVSRTFPGTTGRGVLALMFLHVIAGVITVLLLRAQGLPKAPAVLYVGALRPVESTRQPYSPGG